MILAVWGHVGCGKTGLLLDLAATLRAHGRVVGGVVQPRIFEDDRLVGYALRDVLSGQQVPFARRVPGRRSRGWDFDSAGWGWAERCLMRACEQADVVILDELGLFEAEGGGHLPALLAALRSGRQVDWVLGVRDRALPAIERAVGGYSARVPVQDAPGPDAYRPDARGPNAQGVEAILAALSRGDPAAG